MANPSSTFTEMVTTTLRHSGKEVTDNVSNHNALLRRMKDKGNIKTVSGGYEIQEPLEYAENGTYQRYAGYEALNTQASDVLTSAKYEWQQVALQVIASGREIRMNSGKEAMINLSFNLGQTRLQKLVKALDHMASGSYDLAANEFMDSRWSKQVGQRAVEVTEMIRTGKYGT